MCITGVVYANILSITSRDSVYEFTNAGATGRLGPTQNQVDSAYSGTTLDGQVTINSSNQGIQEWEVPVSGQYYIDAYGAGGGGTNAGGGARMADTYNLVRGEVILILVGQTPTMSDTTDSRIAHAGGGGSFVVKGTDPSKATEDSIIIIAGGGGGSEGDPGSRSTNDQRMASIGKSGEDGYNGSTIDGDGGGSGGQNGEGGKTASSDNAGGGGGGFFNQWSDQ
jgi:hypothetical protein